MKKIILFLVTLCLLFVPVTIANAEEEIVGEGGDGEIIEQIEEEPTFPCNIKINKAKYGDIAIDVDGGEEGQIVTIFVAPYMFYKLTHITVNNTEIVPNSDGEYKFALTLGDNVVEAVFEIDDVQMEKIAELLAQAKDGEWDEIFSLKNLITLVFGVLSVLMSSGFLLTLVKNKKIEAETANSIKKTFNDVIENTMKGTIDEYLQNVFTKSIEALQGRAEKTEALCLTMTKCFALSQENTPESRIAIITELAKLDTNVSDVSKEVKAIIDEEISKLNKAQEEKIKAIEDLEKANEAIEVKEIEEEKVEEGRI